MTDSVFESLSQKLLALGLDDAEIQILDDRISRRIQRADACSAAGVALVAPEELLPADVQRSIVERTAHALGTDAVTARAAFADALELLAGSAAAGDDVGMSPSPAVDEAWHQFVLFTAEYQRYCHLVAGRFLHHCPSVPGRPPKQNVLGPQETFARLVSAGRPLHAELWAPPSIDDLIDRLTSH